MPVFVTIRIHLARVCASEECYEGVQPSFGLDAVRTSWFNFLSPFPGAGDNELRAELARAGMAGQYPDSPQPWSVAVAVVLVGVLAAVWWATRPRTSEPHPRSQAAMLLAGAGLALLVAIGTAVALGISTKTQVRVTEPGDAYRNMVPGWIGLSLAVVLVVLAIGLLWPRRVAPALWLVLALTLGTIAATTQPANVVALRAARVLNATTEAINVEVVRGDLSPTGAKRRCDLFRRIDDPDVPEYARPKLKQSSNVAFKIFHGQPFCR